MADNTPTSPLGTPDDMPMISSAGELVPIPKENVQEAMRRGARQATPEEIEQALHGGAKGMALSALQGAGDTATLGVGTGVALDIARALKGEQGRNELAASMKATRHANPFSYMFGAAAPLALLPEGEGGAGGAFVRGMGEMAVLQEAQGVSEDALDPGLTADAYWAHYRPLEVLVGGVLNAGVASGFKLAAGADAKAISTIPGMGRAGAMATEDANLVDRAILAGQKAGRLSSETEPIAREVQSYAQQVANVPKEQQGAMLRWIDENYLQRQATSPEDLRALRRILKDGVKTQVVLGNELDASAKAASTHIESLIEGLQSVDHVQFGVKGDTVRRLIDTSRVREQADAGLGVMRELHALLNEPTLPEPPRFPKGPKLPKEPAPLERYHSQFLREFEKNGVKTTDEFALRERSDRALEFAKAAREGDMVSYQTEVERLRAEHGEEVARVMKEHEAAVAAAKAEHAAKIREDVPLEFRDIPTSSNFFKADVGELRSAIATAQKEFQAGLKMLDMAETEADRRFAAGKLQEALVSLRRNVGRGDAFGKRAGSDSASYFRRWFYENRMRPLLEDGNVWGAELATMEKETNALFHDGFVAQNEFIKSFGQPVSSHDAGVLTGKVRYAPNSKAIRSYMEEIGLYPTMDQDVVQKTIDMALARAQKLRQHYDLDPKSLAALEKAERGAVGLKDALDRAAPVASDLRRIREMRAVEANRGVHGILGTLVNAAANPVRTLEMVAGLQKVLKSTKDWLSGESKSFMRGETAPVVKSLTTDAERTAAKKALADVQRYREDPRQIALSLKPMLGPMPDLAPRVAASIATTAARGIAYLMQIAPQPLPPRITDKTNEVRYDPGELAKWWEKKQLVENPKLAMQRLRAGQLHEEDVDLLQATIPDLFASMRQQLLKDVLEARKRGDLRTLTYQEQMCLSWMVGAPLDSTQSPAFARSMQESAAQDPTNQAAIGMSAMGGGRPAGKTEIDTDRFKTTTDRMMEK